MTTPPIRTTAVPEAPFWLEINGRRTQPWSCLPDRLDALAVGWLLAEGYLAPGDPVPAVDTVVDDGVFGARVALPEEWAARVEVELEHRREHGCGLLHYVRCDRSRFRRARPTGGPPDTDFAALFRELYAAADRYHDTGGLHSAALSDGHELWFQVEEVGRHNAVDKTIGLALLGGRVPDGLGLVSTARISGEIALKAARAGLAWIASRSVPTTLALAIAEVAGISIVARAAGKNARVYRPGALRSASMTDTPSHAAGSTDAATVGTHVTAPIAQVSPMDHDVPSNPWSSAATVLRTTDPRPLGAILAGGQSRRYGAPKALAGVGGQRIVDRVLAALRTVAVDPVLIANDASLFSDLGLPTRPDVRQGLGVLGGILTALHWAHEEGRPGILAVACDMPFLSPALLGRLLAEAPGNDIVAAESGGRRGVEPLCAYYGVGCIPAIEAELQRGERHIVGFYDDVRVRRVPRADVLEFGDPEILFLNVNTPEERERAEQLATRLVEAGHRG